MGQPVPKDDLPGNLVPSSDMPGASGSEAKKPDALERYAPYYLGPLGPARAIRDASSALDRTAYKAGGAVTDAATAIGLPAPAAAGLGTAANIGVQAVPTIAGGEVAKIASPSFRTGARELMQSALKPSKAALKSGKAGEAIETMLEKGANVTEGGVQKLTAAIDDLDERLTQVLSTSEAKISKMEVLKPIKDALAQFRKQSSTAKNLEEIRDAAREFFHHPSLRGKAEIPIQQAQEMKRANYRELGDRAYGLGLKPEAQREGVKAVTRGLKEGIERAAPEAAGINAEMGPLINARDLAQERVLMSGNKNPLGLGIIADPRLWLPWMADRSELAKSLAARGMNAGAEVIPQAAGNAAGAAVGYEMGRRPKEQTR